MTTTPRIELTRRGDFYQAFSDDAILIGKVLKFHVDDRCGRAVCNVPTEYIDYWLQALNRAGVEVLIPLDDEASS